MKLILIRHGNTFGPDDTPVWVGGQDDLPLVAKGRAQAAAVAAWLKAQEIAPVRIITGPLSRTAETAEIIARDLERDTKILIDERLREIDYGAWSMKTTEQLIDIYGEQEVADWQTHSVFPTRGGWSPSEDQLIANLDELLWDVISEGHGPDDAVLIVSSNGVLRYFLKAIPGEFEERIQRREIKVATGALCVLDVDEDDLLAVEVWNHRPEPIESDDDPEPEHSVVTLSDQGMEADPDETIH